MRQDMDKTGLSLCSLNETKLQVLEYIFYLRYSFFTFTSSSFDQIIKGWTLIGFQYYFYIIEIYHFLSTFYTSHGHTFS